MFNFFLLPQGIHDLKSYELLNRIVGEGLNVEYKFTRAPCIYSSTMVAVELILKNTSSKPVNKINIGDKVCHSFLPSIHW